MDSQKAWKLRKKYGSVRKKISKEYQNITGNRPEHNDGKNLVNAINQVKLQGINIVSSNITATCTSALADHFNCSFQKVEAGAAASNNVVSILNTNSQECIGNKEGSVVLNPASNVTWSSEVADSITYDFPGVEAEVISEESIEGTACNNVNCADLSCSDTDTALSTTDFIKNVDFRNNFRKWAIKFNISHVALSHLSEILNNTFPNILPKDPRALLHTPRNINIKPIAGSGEYWHNGIKIPLTKIIRSWAPDEIPDSISLNFNFDGLPIYKSSKQEFWPILCNIFETPEENPFIIGIYSGNSKPKDLDAYLNDFVEEMLSLLQNGIHIEEIGKTIKINIRIFICDSPARAFIKGVCNFNGRHGCLKCSTVGDYSHKSHTVIFPQTRCPDRTDSNFRQKMYGAHHKVDTPLLKLPIDMIQDFPVGDSLHLIDLGIMKRFLTGWRDGNFGKYLTKWSARDIDAINIFLNQCRMPSEIHRAVRQLDTLAHWKGSEFRTFFFYLSIVILPDVLSSDVIEHFLSLFCAITICYTQKYRRFLQLSKTLLYNFVERYKDFYGADYITSNVHNLTHITDEVKRFGPLQTFNAYPFENKLYVIKNMLRQGNNVLSQVAKRLGESDRVYEIEMKTFKHSEFKVIIKKSGPILKFKNFVISSKPQDKYFMTKNKDIIEFKKVIDDTRGVCIYGNKLLNKTDQFNTPIKSSFLNIYKVSTRSIPDVVLTAQDIMCKLVCIEHKRELYVFPLLHTFL